MKSRFIVVMVSLILAVAATLGVAFYIAQLKSSVTEGQKLVEVVVVKTPVRAGASVAELSANGSIAVTKMPKQYISEGAITSINGYEEKIVSIDLGKGEQLTANRFKKVNEAALAYRIPDNMVAVSIAIDEVTGVGGKLQPGDKVDIIATFSPGPNSDDMTKRMLQGVEVLATSDSGTDEQGGFVKGQQSGMGKKTVTLAVFPAHAEKLVFAAEKGHIWLSLRRNGNSENVVTDGQTVKSIFK